MTNNRWMLSWHPALLNIPGVLFLYWDREAKVFEILLFERKVFYFSLEHNHDK
jgi:hypothetical protein